MYQEQKIIVSICCITYNHVSYIKQCLDGFLMQKTDFPVEIIINDDASNDGTTEIIREYVQKYPDLIHPVYQEKNLYSQGVRGMLQKFVFPKVKGKYIALCEGDDYWTNPYKLQQQVDFMEANPDCSLCFHPVSFLSMDIEEDDPYKDKIKYGYSSLGESEIPTCSMMFRSSLIANIPTHPNFEVADILFIKTCSLYGRFFCLDDEMAVYRRHAGGWTRQARFITNQLLFKHFLAERDVFHDKHILDITDKLILIYFRTIRHASQWGYIKAIFMALKIFPVRLWFVFFRKGFLSGLKIRILSFANKK